MSFLENYEDVAARIQRFWATYKDGKIHTSIMDINLEKGYVLVECRVYRHYEDAEPAGIDYAFGNVNTYNVQMKKWFVEDTCTSAIGRCVGLVLGTDKRPTMQNMQQVERIDPKIVQDSAVAHDYWNTKHSDVPSYKTREEAEAAGSIEATAVLLNLEHDRTRRIGKTLSVESNDKGIEATYKIANTTAGTDALEAIKETLGGVQVAAAPLCSHGHMIWREGTSAKTNKGWGGYMCSEKAKAKQCAPAWYMLGSDGQWRPQV